MRRALRIQMAPREIRGRQSENMRRNSDTFGIFHRSIERNFSPDLMDVVRGKMAFVPAGHDLVPNIFD